jgi:HD-GYP domain-containing protein (c-di-GMP phosphodiesterase class II)
MYSRSVDRLAPGAVLGRTIHDVGGRPLLVAGTPLTARYIASLQRLGILTVLVRDGLADDVAPDDIVSERVRATLSGHVATAFDRVAIIAAERGGIAGGVDGAVDRLGEQPLELGDDGQQSVADLYRDVEALIAEILERDTLAGLESLKTHNEYTFQHSVDVAVVGVLLGKRVGLPPGRLRELALGCLLHDIGKTYIDVAILDKPGPLTPEEFAAIQEHPRMGFELIRRMPVHSILPAHVAYQHHEQQAGGGYPRGLVGQNRVGMRAAQEQVGAGQMLLIAEIAAIADVYSALSSDRPYRPAMAPDRVAQVLQGMAGTHLNRELVTELRHLVPSYPVGHWVEVTRGRYVGWRGVVTEVHRGHVDEPSVRLLLDARGEATASPVELELRGDVDAELRCLAANQVPTAGQPVLVP